MCSGYWNTCNCEDCKKVSSLYEELEWLEKDRDFNKDEIKEVENKIESMGYFI